MKWSITKIFNIDKIFTVSSVKLYQITVALCAKIIKKFNQRFVDACSFRQNNCGFECLKKFFNLKTRTMVTEGNSAAEYFLSPSVNALGRTCKRRL